MTELTIKEDVLYKINDNFPSHHQSYLKDFIKNADPNKGIALGAHFSGIRVWRFLIENSLYRIFFDYDLGRNTIRVIDIDLCDIQSIF